MFRKHLILLFGIAVSCSSPSPDNVSYADPFIGTSEFGHTFPCATVPTGMIQAGPETGNCNWKYTAGYQHADSIVTGFSQTRLSGTGVPDLGDILIFPFTGDTIRDTYSDIMDKSSETASPGYYSVILKDSGIKAEMTVSEHVAYHRYSYPDGAAQHLILDLQSGLVTNPERLTSHIIDYDIDFSCEDRISGYIRCRSWLEREYWFTIVFDRDIVTRTDIGKRNTEEKIPRYVLSFGKGGTPLQVKISLSTTSVSAAINNMDTEVPDWEFCSIRSEAREKWDGFLNRIDISGDDNRKAVFYTAMYHLYTQPNNIADNGEVPAYSTLSLWDTYRAAHPLYTILTPDLAGSFINSMLDQYDRQGFLPIWALWGGETYCMIGNHAVPAIVDAYLKGIEGPDYGKAYQAVRRSLTEDHQKSDWKAYDRYGYYPCDMFPREAVSRTVESVYDDYCASVFADRLGFEEDAAFFRKRSDYYKNLLDPSTGFMRGKDSEGRWRTPFNPFAIGHKPDTDAGDYTEGNAWQYTWHVQHDVEGLIRAIGGKERFTEKLDSLFEVNPDEEKKHGFVLDVTGHIGQYAHGNEPSHHVAYLYAWTDKPWRTQELVREIIETKYLNKVEGLCGNEDCGQMSAWYIFSCMGFYPVNPCGGTYIIGAPQQEYMEISLPEGRRFRITASGISDTNKYVSSVTLNGHPLTERYITHEQIMQGGELAFTMTGIPCDYLQNN